jgi:hypothetical protein
LRVSVSIRDAAFLKGKVLAFLDFSVDFDSRKKVWEGVRLDFLARCLGRLSKRLEEVTKE